MSGNIHWSPEEDARLRLYVDQGQPWGAIAVLMDATYATVFARARRMGLTPRTGIAGFSARRAWSGNLCRSPDAPPLGASLATFAAIDRIRGAQTNQ